LKAIFPRIAPEQLLQLIVMGVQNVFVVEDVGGHTKGIHGAITDRRQ
jgi:hypothetical protein